MDAVMIVDALPRHVAPIANTADEATKASCALFGHTPRQSLRAALSSSSYCRTLLLDGKPAAMWGVAGPLLSPTGEGWVALTPAARARRLLVARITIAELRNVMRLKTEILAGVACGDARGQRFARFLGFVAGPTAEVHGMPFTLSALRSST